MAAIRDIINELRCLSPTLRRSQAKRHKYRLTDAKYFFNQLNGHGWWQRRYEDPINYATPSVPCPLALKTKRKAPILLIEGSHSHCTGYDATETVTSEHQDTHGAEDIVRAIYSYEKQWGSMDDRIDNLLVVAAFYILPYPPFAAGPLSFYKFIEMLSHLDGNFEDQRMELKKR